MFELLTDLQTYLSLVTLTALEIVLGIDNILFLSLVANKLPECQRETARKLGLSLALFGRLALLFSLSWLLSFQKPLFAIFERSFSVHSLILGIGGLFLIYKATQEIFYTLEGFSEERQVKAPSLKVALAQILMLDLVFSLDSIITAVGLSSEIIIMSIAISIAVIIMLFASKFVSEFLDQNPSMKILGLAFLLIVGLLLLTDALGEHISRAYLYFALGFSVFVEIINLKHKAKSNL